MASGLMSAGVDLDTLFAARVGTKGADCGYQLAGVDISNRYEARTGTARANVGFQSGAVDLAQRFQDIAIASGDTYPLVNASPYSESTGVAIASYQLQATGDVALTVTDNTLTDAGHDWIAPKTNMANYSARVTMVSGSLTSGTVGSLVPLNANATWQLSRSPFGTATAVCNLEIVRNSDSATVKTVQLSFTAIRNEP